MTNFIQVPVSSLKVGQEFKRTKRSRKTFWISKIIPLTKGVNGITHDLLLMSGCRQFPAMLTDTVFLYIPVGGYFEGDSNDDLPF